MHKLGSRKTRQKQLPASQQKAPAAGGVLVSGEADVGRIFNDIERIRKAAMNAKGFRSKKWIAEGRVDRHG